jgi:LAGLIDADG endonuclease
MGNRGSKSVLKFTVKEQRVDGSWSNYSKLLLRCTLMGCESSYPVKIPSKQLNRLFFSTVSGVKPKLNPYFVTGFADAESCFCTTIVKNVKLKTFYRVRAFFAIRLNQRDRFLLIQLQEFFGGIGTISFDKKAKAFKYSVDSFKDLTTTIIPHFKKYPLLTQKAADFLLFEQVVELMSVGSHLTVKGLQEIVNINASMNLGSSDIVKSKFSKINPVERAIIQTTNIPDPNWVSGFFFFSGEGNFDAGIRTATNKIGYRVYLRFRVTQHARDTQLMELLIKYLGAGRLEKDYRKNKICVNLVIGNFSDLTQIIVPFFNQYPILGVVLNA